MFLLTLFLILIQIGCLIAIVVISHILYIAFMAEQARAVIHNTGGFFETLKIFLSDNSSLIIASILCFVVTFGICILRAHLDIIHENKRRNK